MLPCTVWEWGICVTLSLERILLAVLISVSRQNFLFVDSSA